MTTATMPRRLTDRVILYGVIVASLATILGALNWTSRTYNQFSGALELAPRTAERVERLEVKQDSQEERLWVIEWWVTEMGKKAGISAPPRRRRGNP